LRSAIERWIAGEAAEGDRRASDADAGPEVSAVDRHEELVDHHPHQVGFVRHAADAGRLGVAPRERIDRSGEAEERGREEDQPGHEPLEDRRRRLQQQHGAEDPAGEGRQRSRGDPAPEPAELAAEAVQSRNGPGHERDGVRRVGDDRLAAEPHQHRKGDERAAAGDRVHRAGGGRGGEQDGGLGDRVQGALEGRPRGALDRSRSSRTPTICSRRLMSSRYWHIGDRVNR
jgi:hypothetical protein